MVRVAKIEAGSIAAELQIVPGTEFRTINGQAIRDFLDWEFLSAEEEIVVEGLAPNGEETVWEIEREEGRALGIELEPPTIRRCANRCEFCFIEGLPPGLRTSLYVRDDDYRLSFAYGNFATLSNLKERDYERILSYRLSPLYVSVHATPVEARRVLLNNERVPDIIAQLTRLAAGGISFHCQMVVVPGLNDGDVLQQSLSDLWDLGDAVLSTAVVPVGLTQFSHLFTGRSMDRDTARGILDQLEPWAKRARQARGEAWVYGSDELYMLAELELPTAEHYGDYAQIENGVGAVTYLRERVRGGLPELPRLDGKRIGVLTGRSMRDIMPEILGWLTAATGASFETRVLENTLFGPTTTASGLLPGADILRGVESLGDVDVILVPAETINDSGVFLDDRSFADVSASSSIPMTVSYDFIDVLSDLPGALAAPTWGATR